MSNIVIYGYGGDGENIPIYGYGGEWLPRPIPPEEPGATPPAPTVPPIIMPWIFPVRIKVKIVKDIKDIIKMPVFIYKDIKIVERMIAFVYMKAEKEYNIQAETIAQLSSIYPSYSKIYSNKRQKTRLSGYKSYKRVGKALDESFLCVLLELYSRRKKHE